MNTKRYFNIFALLILGCWTACTKDKAASFKADNSLIPAVLADNFNLSLFDMAVKKTRMDKMLEEKGPFTVLAPSDAAFAANGDINTVSIDLLSKLVRQHIVDSSIQFEKLPYQFNKEFTTSAGKMYVTHWVRGFDTAVTINGARILHNSIPASNGSIYVVSRVMQPMQYKTLVEAMAADENLVLFTQAMRIAGYLDSVASSKIYTIFAPNNAAMEAYGYTTLQSVSETDPAELRQFVAAHLLRDRRFISDYILSADANDTYQQVMIDEQMVPITLMPDYYEEGSYTGVYLQNPQTMQMINLTKQDQIAGNGILHTIDGVLTAH